MKDHLGSTKALTYTSGAIVSSTSYDSFGNATTSIATSYQYTGREYDSDTGLYYYRNRWYDPEIGRFISEDPIGFAGGDVNLYGYVGNNPLSFIDPFGFWRCSSNDPPGSSGWWDAVQGALDVAGLAPGVGIIADLTNAGISVARGNYADASLSMAAAVPLAGTVAGLAKLARKAKKALGKAFSKARLPKREVKKQRNKPPEPLEEAQGRPHSIVEKPGAQGQYTTYNADGTFKQFRGSGKPHGNIPRPNVKEYRINRAPDGRKFINKPRVRPARPDEIPRGDG